MFQTNQIHKIMNHPVHIKEEDGKWSPSAMIPFCGFEGNMSFMGVNMDHFDVPVCNSFRATILNDQLCYEVDPNEFTDDVLDKSSIKSIHFYVDTNDDRQTKAKDTDFMIYLDTLSKSTFIHYIFFYPNGIHYFSSSNKTFW